MLKIGTKQAFDVALFALCFGLFLGGYFYGYEGDQEQLPLIFRTLDPTFLQNDFFAGTADSFGPRYYFLHLIAGFAHLFGITLGYYLLTVIANVLTGLVSGLFALWVFNESRIAGYLTTTLVLSVQAIGLANSGELRTSTFIPLHGAMPFLLMGVWAAFSGRWIIGAIAFLLASFLHPLLAYGTFAYVVASVCLYRVFFGAARFWNLRNMLVAGGILFISAVLFWLIPSHSFGKISDDKFIYILAFFRHPHHYIPSHFLSSDYYKVFAFLTTLTLLTRYFFKTLPANCREILTLASLLCLVLLIGCVAGYVFTEILPLRIAVTAQPFRFLYLLKWFGFVLYAGYIAQQVQTRRDPASIALAAVLAVGAMSPYTMLSAVLFTMWTNRSNSSGTFVWWLLCSAVLFSICKFFTTYRVEIERTLFFYLLAVTLLLQLFKSSKANRLIIVSSAIIFFCCIRFGIDRLPFQFGLNWERFWPKFDITQYPYPGPRNIGAYLRSSTPKDAILITPPNGGWTRFLGERAIIVDHKAFPFPDNEMIEWYSRIQDVYGPTEGLGDVAFSQMMSNYQHISRDKLLSLSKKYNASYAVLFSETVTDLPIVFSANEYKVAKLR